jgi:hypothetical protein
MVCCFISLLFGFNLCKSSLVCFYPICVYKRIQFEVFLFYRKRVFTSVRPKQRES